LRFRGELGRLTDAVATGAEDDLRGAVRSLDDFGARFYAARARLSLGNLLVETGRAAEAGRPLEEATRTFEDLGAGPWVERSRRILATGSSAPAHVVEETAQLSPR
jgi:hypothetical protein